MNKKEINELSERVSNLLKSTGECDCMVVINDEAGEQVLSIVKGNDSKVASAIYSTIMDEKNKEQSAALFKIVADVMLNIVRSDVSKAELFMNHLNHIITAKRNYLEN